MRLFSPSLDKKSTLVLSGVTLILIGFIGFLVAANYQAQRRVRAFAMAQLRHDTETRADALSYYFSERRNDLENLASSRSILVFFENKALGMSMEYGLKASLVAISETFDRLLRERELEGAKIYNRIVFIDGEGAVLVDVPTGRKEKAPKRDWKSFLTPDRLTGAIVIEHKRPLEVVASRPYFFKNRYMGQIVAWISSGTIYQLVEGSEMSSRYPVVIACDKDHMLARPGTLLDDPALFLPALGRLKNGEIHQFETLGKDGSKAAMVAPRIPVQGAPLYVIAVVSLSEVGEGLAAWYLPLGMGILAVLVLCGAVIAYRINTRKLILNARLDEASRSRKEIEEKNRRLKDEIRDRRQAEAALKGLSLDLEKRVEKRTAELTLAVAQLSVEIEERKNAEAGLKASEKRTKRLIEVSPVGICIHQRGMYVYANPAFVKTFGFETPDEIVGRPLDSLFVPEDRSLVTTRGKELLEGKKVPLSYEVRGLKKDGKAFAAGFWGTIIDYKNAPAVLGFAVDMNIERELRSQLRESQKMEAIGTLAGGIAHDFNNILSAVIGYAELAKMEASEEGRMMSYLDGVLKAGDRAKKLVRQILTVSRQSEEGRKAIAPIYVVKEAMKLLRASVPTSIQFDQQIEKDTGMILADPTRIHQILMNLCTNAHHAMLEEGGVLTVHLGNVAVGSTTARYMGIDPGAYVKLTVSDTGHGMPPEVVERIFEPYYTTKEKGEGTGLGLSVVRGIVVGCGGKISVDSTPGKGTTFHVYFPRIDAVDKETAASGPSVEFPVGTERILFVDDEEILVNIGKQVLERLGYEVAAFTSSMEALERFSEDPDKFDLIITDLTMPEMTGDRLAREVRNLRPGMPVIVCSGFMDKISREKAKSKGATAFIEKPLTLEKLASMVREVLDEG